MTTDAEDDRITPLLDETLTSPEFTELIDPDPADAMHDSVTSLTYVQLADAMAASAAEQETRMARFLAAAQDAYEIATQDHGTGCGCLEEAKSAMDSEWAGYKAQSALTRAIAAELNKRIKDRNYA